MSGTGMAVIVGHGRSGTNWLLDILNASALTHCRNEAYACEGSAMARLLSSRSVVGLGEDELRRGWDAAVEAARSLRGSRDPIPGRKIWNDTFLRRWGIAQRLEGRRARRVLGLFIPELSGDEWRMPRWLLGDNDRMASAFLVLKLVQAPGWAVWVLSHRPNTPVLHIVRHPGGFLNSWASRYLADRERSCVARANEERLNQVVSADADFASLFGPPSEMGVEESELWYWRYSAEKIHAAGEGRPNYKLIVYEDLHGDFLRTAQEVYEFCGVPWDGDTETRVMDGRSPLEGKKTGWRDKLSSEQVALVERVLDGSPLSTLWQTG